MFSDWFFICFTPPLHPQNQLSPSHPEGEKKSVISNLVEKKVHYPMVPFQSVKDRLFFFLLI